MERRFEFEVEFVMNRRGRPSVIFARRLTSGDFVLDETSTLGGYPVQPQVQIPRALDRAGKLRFDLFAFSLANRSDRTNFARGQRVELVARDP